MGNTLSHKRIKSFNYNCPICMEEGKLPNIAGRIIIINNSDCQCNGCKTIYPKSYFNKRFTKIS